jgi:hypothetical protein
VARATHVVQHAADEAIVPAHVEQKILLLRGERVMLDADLAALYGVETRALTQAVKRNRERFPGDFMFQLRAEEAVQLRSQTVISNPSRGGRRYAPYAFTEHGVTMLAAVLQSPRAVLVSIEVVRAFVRLRAMLAGNAELCPQAHRPREAVRRAVQGRVRRHSRAHGAGRAGAFAPLVPRFKREEDTR